jgi:hypothetical protein
MLIVVRTFLGSAAVITVAASFFRLRRRVRELEADLRNTDFHDARVDALEAAVERLAAQLEQVTSGQEFLNRVAANQPARLPSPTQSPPVVTPH